LEGQHGQQEWIQQLSGGGIWHVQYPPGQVISEYYSTGAYGRLPYVKYTTKRWPRYDGVFIDEERVIGILAGFSSTFMV